MHKRISGFNMAPLFLRTIVGIGFIIHGYAKISRGTAGFEKLLVQVGVPFAHINAIVVPYVELIGGLAVLTGLFVNIVAIPLIITMLVATYTVQFHYGFSSVNTIGLTPAGPKFGPPGYEINLLYIGCLISLIFTGSGILSVDSWRSKWYSRVKNKK
ncbi:DoxX family protein [Arachidicoccus soli]|uniref:DoxX family protein n=1 Tax=Arachidicoccus soli TaxID=2341117 RepID=A0A386HU28_9BACT|nr:DoxX family protein [Arachidicoccus soli]AYD49333.1 DoxX family protein [Arachidicoccus soli]